MPETVFCPVCENDFKLPKNELRKAAIQRNKTGGKILIGCWDCARVLVVQGVPSDGVEEWAAQAEKSNDWLSCIPMLDKVQEDTPTGSNADLKYIRYRSGANGPLMDRRAYMMAYGIDPLIHMALNPGMGGAAFKITDSRR
jgi:hypothetical protein